MNTPHGVSITDRYAPRAVHGVLSAIDRARNTVDRAGSTARGVWSTDDGAPGTVQGVGSGVEDAPRTADGESDRKDGDWNRGDSAFCFQQYEMLDQPDHQFFLIGLAFGHQQCQRHQGVVIDQLLYRFRQQVLVDAQVP